MKPLYKGRELDTLTKEELIEAVIVLDRQWRETMLSYISATKLFLDKISPIK